MDAQRHAQTGSQLFGLPHFQRGGVLFDPGPSHESLIRADEPHLGHSKVELPASKFLFAAGFNNDKGGIGGIAFGADFNLAGFEKFYNG
jgi:hypothetical protein